MWPFSMQIIPFGSLWSGKHSLFLHAWCLRSDGMTDVWIYEKLLAGICIKVLDLLTKNVFCHPISFHFYLCNHFQSPVFSQWHSSAKSLQSSPSDSHSLTQPDPSWHMSFILIPWWCTVSQPGLAHFVRRRIAISLWPFNKHVHRDTFMDGLPNRSAAASGLWTSAWQTYSVIHP